MNSSDLATFSVELRQAWTNCLELQFLRNFQIFEARNLGQVVLSDEISAILQLSDSSSYGVRSAGQSTRV